MINAGYLLYTIFLVVLNGSCKVGSVNFYRTSPENWEREYSSGIWDSLGLPFYWTKAAVIMQVYYKKYANQQPILDVSITFNQ
jgi:hypothetical protein